MTTREQIIAAAKEAGGKFHGPIVEHLSVSEDDSALKVWLGDPVWASSKDLKLVEEFRKAHV